MLLRNLLDNTISFSSEDITVPMRNSASLKTYPLLLQSVQEERDQLEVQVKVLTLSQREREFDHEQREMESHKKQVALIRPDTINRLETGNKEMRRMLVVLKEATLNIEKVIHVTKKSENHTKDSNEHKRSHHPRTGN